MSEPTLASLNIRVYCNIFLQSGAQYSILLCTNSILLQ